MQSDGAVDVREEIAGIAVSLGHALDKDSHGKLVQLVVKQMEDEAADARLPAVYKMQELMEVSIILSMHSQTAKQRGLQSWIFEGKEIFVSVAVWIAFCMHVHRVLWFSLCICVFMEKLTRV